MKINFPFQDGSVKSLALSVGIIVGFVLVTAVLFFYVYLPGVTHRGESITVMDIQGMKIEEAKEFLAKHDLRFVVSDSSYSEKFPPLAVVQQFPKKGAIVKKGRIIYLSVNRVTPPTLPLPDFKEMSLTGAELIMKSNELKRGRIYYRPSPFMNYVLELRYEGKVIEPGTRIPKGAVVDLVVGDGQGTADFRLESLVGDSYERALFKIAGWNLHLGNVEIPDNMDTTGMELFVYKHAPHEGDSVRVGAPVDLWLGPQGYQSGSDDMDKNK